jgi:hypothetical protein
VSNQSGKEATRAAEGYRKLAEEAEPRAVAATDFEAKRMYSQLAASWRDLADQADGSGS